MPVNTAAKRASLLGLVFPDGTLEQGDRQALVDLYSGILAAAPVPVTVASGMVDVAVSLAYGSVSVSDLYAAMTVLASLSIITSTAYPLGFQARKYQADGALTFSLTTQRSRSTLGFYGTFTGDYRQLYA